MISSNMKISALWSILVDTLKQIRWLKEMSLLLPPMINCFQLEELWFTLDVDLLRSALGITPKDHAHPFVAPLARDLVIDFEEFIQAIKTFFSDAASLKVPSKKPKPHVIPYYRFTKLIICYLGGRHNIHKRPQSPLHITSDDYTLGNLKFVPKGELDEVFSMAIPKDLLTDAIHNAKYYPKYLDMAARKPRQPTAVIDEESVKKKKVSPTDKSKKPAPAKQMNHVKEKSTKPTTSTKARKGKVLKVQKGKRSDRLVDEEDKEPQPALEPQIEDDEYNLQRGVTRSLLVVEGKGKAIATDEQAAQSLLELQQLKKKNSKTGADTENSNSEGDTEILNVDEERGENISNIVALEERIVELDEGQARSNPGNTLESRPPPDEEQAGSNPRPSQVALDRPNPEPMHEDFIAINLDDDFTFGDQFIDDKPPEEEPGKANVESKVESMVTVHIYQASSSAPPLSTPIIDLTTPKTVSPPIQEPVFTTTTETTSTLLLPPPPPQQQSTTDPELANRISAPEEICANLGKKNKQQDQTS
ncbi:hypothetical protein Tco_1164179 [Tanacetum coccineum]